MSNNQATPAEETRPRARSPLLEAHRFLRRGPVSEEGWSQLVAKDRAWERSYRGRWAHDKVVRSTHGVNYTGSCSWQVFVKDGAVRVPKAHAELGQRLLEQQGECGLDFEGGPATAG